MNEQAENITWMKGCTICPEGMCEEIDKLISEQKLSQRAAVKTVTGQANRSVGVDGFFSPQSIRMKYRRFKGIDDPPKKSGTKRTTQEPEPEPATEPDPDMIDYNATASDMVKAIQTVMDVLKRIGENEDQVTDRQIRGDLMAILYKLPPLCSSTVGKLNR